MCLGLCLFTGMLCESVCQRCVFCEFSTLLLYIYWEYVAILLSIFVQQIELMFKHISLKLFFMTVCYFETEFLSESITKKIKIFLFHNASDIFSVIIIRSCMLSSNI